MIKFPRIFIKSFFLFIGKGNFYKKLYNSQTIDLSKCKKLTGWEPPIKMEDALKKVANEYMHNSNSIL